MSAEQVEEAYERAAILPSERSVNEEVPFAVFAARPPGFLDIRVFDQTQWWVDVMRTPHRLADLDDTYLNNLIAFLICGASWFRRAYQLAYPCCDPGATAGTWLERTALMRALRDEQYRRVTRVRQ